jgi:hypothetical protein
MCGNEVKNNALLIENKNPSIEKMYIGIRMYNKR